MSQLIKFSVSITVPDGFTDLDAMTRAVMQDIAANFVTYAPPDKTPFNRGIIFVATGKETFDGILGKYNFVRNVPASYSITRNLSTGAAAVIPVGSATIDTVTPS